MATPKTTEKKTDKVFVGQVKVIKGEYGDFHSISFGDKDRKILEEKKNAKGWTNLTLKKKKDSDDYYLELNTYSKE